MQRHVLILWNWSNDIVSSEQTKRELSNILEGDKE